MDYKAESARLSLELTLWKNYKDFQEYLRLNELCRFMVKERFNNSKWCVNFSKVLHDRQQS